jgi:hypothetical protein
MEYVWRNFRFPKNVAAPSPDGACHVCIIPKGTLFFSPAAYFSEVHLDPDEWLLAGRPLRALAAKDDSNSVASTARARPRRLSG